jgi:hypothetical protein
MSYESRHEEAQVQARRAKREAHGRHGAALVPDDREAARPVRLLPADVQAGRRDRVQVRAQGDPLPAVRGARPGVEGLPPVDPVGAQPAGGPVRSVSKPHSLRRRRMDARRPCLPQT